MLNYIIHLCSGDREQKKTFTSWFSPSTTWTLGIKLRGSGLAEPSRWQLFPISWWLVSQVLAGRASAAGSALYTLLTFPDSLCAPWSQPSNLQGLLKDNVCFYQACSFKQVLESHLHLSMHKIIIHIENSTRFLCVSHINMSKCFYMLPFIKSYYSFMGLILFSSLRPWERCFCDHRALSEALVDLRCHSCRLNLTEEIEHFRKFRMVYPSPPRQYQCCQQPLIMCSWTLFTLAFFF